MILFKESYTSRRRAGSEGVRNNGFWRCVVRLDERRCGLMLVLLGRGRSCHSIARELGGSPSTVRKVAVEAGIGVPGVSWTVVKNLSLFEHVR